MRSVLCALVALLALSATGCGRLNSERPQGEADLDADLADARLVLDAELVFEGEPDAGSGCVDRELTTLAGPLIHVEGDPSGSVVIHGPMSAATRLDASGGVLDGLAHGGPETVDGLRGAMTAGMLGLVWSAHEYTGWQQTFLTRFDPASGASLGRRELTPVGFHAFQTFGVARGSDLALVYEGDVPALPAYQWEAVVVDANGAVRWRRTWDRNMIEGPRQIVDSDAGYLLIAVNTSAIYELSPDLTTFTVGDSAPRDAVFVHGTPAAPALIAPSPTGIVEIAIGPGGRLAEAQTAVPGARFDAASAYGPPERRWIAWRDGGSLSFARLGAGWTTRRLGELATGPVRVLPGVNGALVFAGRTDGAVAIYEVCDR